MKFYIKPCFSKEKSYYSLVTSFLIFSFSIYYILSNKGTVSLQYLLFLVGFTSILHHCRSFSDEYKDFIRILLVFATDRPAWPGHPRQHRVDDPVRN